MGDERSGYDKQGKVQFPTTIAAALALAIGEKNIAVFFAID